MNDFIPYPVDNALTSMGSPSTVHVRNTGLARFFKRYLLQDAMSPFVWTLPKTWDRTYFFYVLYVMGFIGVINTDKFGVIPQHGGLGGYNVFYMPRFMIINNPLFETSIQPVIGQDCEVIRLQPDYRGLYDLVDYYGDLMALAAEAAGMNLVNSKLSFVFAAENKASAESYKKMFDNVQEGNPAVVIDKDLLDDDGTLRVNMFAQNVGENFIADKLLGVLSTIEYKFRTAIGIPNVGFEKSERLTEAESKLNGYATNAKCALWLDEVKKCCERVNAMFGAELQAAGLDLLSVDLRPEFKEILQPSAEEVKDNAG